MNYNTFQPKLKIILILALALGISILSSNTIFLASTPRINTFFLAKAVNFPETVINKTQNYLASLLAPHPTPVPSAPVVAQNNQENTVTFTKTQALQQSVLQKFQSLPTAALNQVAQGIYAKEDTQSNTVYIRLTKDIQWVPQTVNWNGKQITVLYPKK